MKILMLNYEYPPLGGGAGNANYYLLKQFAGQQDIAIDLVTSSLGSFRIDHFAGNINVHYLDIKKNENRLHYQTGRDILTYTIKAFWYARKLQENNSYSLCHAFFGIPSGFIAMFLSLPYIVSLRGSDVPFYNSRFYWPDKLIFRRLSRLIWKKAKYVVANSEGLKQLAQKSTPEIDIKVINNGVDTEQFYPVGSKVPGEKLKLISTGRLIERKGYRYLIEALRDKNQVELTLIGEGNLEDQLKKLAEENGVDVQFAGRVAHEELKHYLNEADVFVLPSLNEGMANSILEAMACGLPVITTDTGGTNELINGNGVIVEKGSALDLANAIDNYLNDDKLIKEHGERSRQLCKKLDWLALSRQYRLLYEDVICGSCI